MNAPNRPPRRDRWLSLLEVAALLDSLEPRLSKLSKRERRRWVRRIAQRAERRDSERYTKRVGRELYVSRNAVETLMPWSPEQLSELERNQARLVQNHKALQRQVNGHGARIKNLEEWRRLATAFVASTQALIGPGSDQH